MWPFTRCKANDAHEDGPQNWRECTPTMSYVNQYVLDMARSGESDRTFRESEPLPMPPGYARCEVPAFESIANRLKVLSGLDPVIYQEIREGEITLRIEGDEFVIHTAFNDTHGSRSVRLRMERTDA